jgi:hypothetical protein
METSFRNNITMNLVFARHETFHPRFGWLKKGFDKTIEFPNLFLREDASTILGVGKNMVKAIKYWCIAFKVLEVVKESGHEKSITPTEFGRNLLSNKGWDPYLEDPASLWLLHWNLLKKPCHATAWFYMFNMFNKSSFIIEDIKNGLIEFKDNSFLNNSISESSIMKDITCILRMYNENNADNKGFYEDSINSPFTELGLLHNYGDSRHFIFNTESKNNLPSHIIVSTCFDYIETINEFAKTISISRLTYETGSPGLCFKLSENNLIDSIENVAKHYDDIYLSDNAGSIQLSFEGEPKALSKKLLNNYYKRGRN